MGNKDNNIISKISIICVGLLISLFVIFKDQIVKKDENSLEKSTKSLEIRKKVMKDIRDVWSGNSDFVCDDYKSFGLIHSEFFSCNPLQIECFLKSKVEFKPISKNFLEFDRRNNPIIKFRTQGLNFSMKLLDICKDTYLPQKKYSAGAKGEDFIWDNFNQDIFIDKKYVSNLEILLWKNQWKKEEFNKNNFYKPSTNLSLKEKKEFCQFKGKQLLESRYFDAASFYNDGMSKNPDFIYKFPYPWTKKRSIRLQDDKPDSGNCANIYASDCESIRKYQFYEPLAPTWIGIFYALGNYPEYFENKLNPLMNLKLSSFYLPFTSPWHQVGKRSSIKEMKKNMEVAFRCMLNK